MKTIVTADVCVNHCGSFDRLIELLNMVYKVQILSDEKILFKMQKRNPDNYSDKPYNSWVLNRTVPYKEHKAALEFSLDDYYRLDEYCLKYDVEWYCSAFDFDSLEFLRNFFPHLRYWKIASPVTADNIDLVKAICEQSGEKFMSTGMCTQEELDFAVGEAVKVDDNITLMHCTSMYPTPNNNVNLSMIETLRNRYGLPVGYSSHDAGVPISVSAVALGAVAIERHITLDRSGPSPDDSLSLAFSGLETMVRHIQAIEEAMGENTKQYYAEEQLIREKVKITT